MTMLLPIPAPKKDVKFFYIPYNIGQGYCNRSGDVKLRYSDSVGLLREEISSLFKIDKSEYIVTKVTDNEFVRWFSCNQTLETLTSTDGVTVLYQVDP